MNWPQPRYWSLPHSPSRYALHGSLLLSLHHVPWSPTWCFLMLVIQQAHAALVEKRHQRWRPSFLSPCQPPSRREEQQLSAHGLSWSQVPQLCRQRMVSTCTLGCRSQLPRAPGGRKWRECQGTGPNSVVTPRFSKPRSLGQVTPSGV